MFWLIVVIAILVGTYLQLTSVKPDVSAFFKGKVVIVTGASSGIGKEVAFQLAKLGARLCLAARREDNLKEVSEQCRKLGSPDVMFVATDVTKDDHCKRLIAETVKRFNQIDVLLLNAGQGSMLSFEEVKEKDIQAYRDLMEVNYWSCVMLTFYGLAHIQKTKGSIVVISSLAGKVGVPFRTGYSPTKHALHGFFDSLRCEQYGKCTVTTICPGFVISEIHDKMHGAKSERNMKEFMTVEQCGNEVLESIARRDREYMMTRLARFGQLIKPWAPGLFDKVVIRKATAALIRDKSE
jgi:short-subunit dehydrogenase